MEKRVTLDFREPILRNTFFCLRLKVRKPRLRRSGPAGEGATGAL